MKLPASPTTLGLIALVATLIITIFVLTNIHNGQLVTQAEVFNAQLKAQTEIHNAQLLSQAEVFNARLQAQTDAHNAQLGARTADFHKNGR